MLLCFLRGHVHGMSAAALAICFISALTGIGVPAFSLDCKLGRQRSWPVSHLLSIKNLLGAPQLNLKLHHGLHSAENLAAKELSVSKGHHSAGFELPAARCHVDLSNVHKLAPPGARWHHPTAALRAGTDSETSTMQSYEIFWPG